MATIPRVGELNEENIGELTGRLQEDEELREEAIEAIKEDPHSAIEEAFELNHVQSRLLRWALDQETAEALGRDYITVLREDGEVALEEVRDEDTPRKMGIPRRLGIQMDFSTKINSFGVASAVLSVMLVK